jgi:hypothetical protein
MSSECAFIVAFPKTFNHRFRATWRKKQTPIEELIRLINVWFGKHLVETLGASSISVRLKDR